MGHIASPSDVGAVGSVRGGIVMISYERLLAEFCNESPDCDNIGLNQIEGVPNAHSIY